MARKRRATSSLTFGAVQLAVLKACDHHNELGGHRAASIQRRCRSAGTCIREVELRHILAELVQFGFLLEGPVGRFQLSILGYEAAANPTLAISPP